MDAKRIAADGLFLALALVVSYIEVGGWNGRGEAGGSNGRTTREGGKGGGGGGGFLW